jgi:5-methylcytosine-specific restriction enzyme B
MLRDNPNFAETQTWLDGGAVQERRHEAEQERAMLLEHFPRESWESMTLEQYARGHEGYEDSLCYLLERKSPMMGSIRGGSSRKFLIYWSSKLDGWWWEKNKYASAEEAWSKIRAGYRKALELAESDQWSQMDDVEATRGAPATRMKVAYLYFPDKLLPVFSTDHLRHFLRTAGREDVIESGSGPAVLNRTLLAELRSVTELATRPTHDLMVFLYRLADPREGRQQLLRVMPGRELKWWDDCRKGSFICIGWPAVGNLDELPELSAVKDAVREAHPEYAATRVGRVANVLQEFRSLVPGDRVIANDGGSRILAVGTVVEPGYRYIAERADSPHTVAVDWDLARARVLDPPQAWRQTTGHVSASFLAGLDVVTPGQISPLFDELAAALERKGQLILFGPPGTGKTFMARRFSVHHLERQNKLPVTNLDDPEAFAKAEERLTRRRTSRSMWWVVASPREWSWAQLATDGHVDYRVGRLRRNYFDLGVGDLVLGYESTPTKRIVALARISGVADDFTGETGFSLEYVATVNDGPSYEELQAMPDLATSEPMRHRSQGTLFALTDLEADALAARLIDGDPTLRQHFEEVTEEGGVGYLTRTTFHPTYGYEDFVEGYRPVQTGAASGLVVELRDGVFSRVCQAALDDREHTYLLLIDEINRANIPRVFGELITLLEADKRGLTLTLPSGRAFQVPPNVQVIGTMNTADRSIRLLDVALRRRFAFVELLPDSGVLADAQVEGVLLSELLDGLNMRLVREVDREHQIGHALFMSSEKPITDPDRFAEAFRHDVLPTLQEYCYADYRQLAQLVGDGLVDLEHQRLKEDVLTDPARLLEHLSTLTDTETNSTDEGQ